MAKKILAGCLAAVVLTSLAWYAGFLHSDRQAEREQSELWQELQSLSERVALQEERKSAEQPEEKAAASVDPDEMCIRDSPWIRQRESRMVRAELSTARREARWEPAWARRQG